MNEKIYLHAINNGFETIYDSKKQLKSLLKILKSNEIKTLRSLGNNTVVSFAGLDYISLSDYEERFISNKDAKNYNAFYRYSREGISFAFNKEDLEVIKPTIIGACIKDNNYFSIIRNYELMKELSLDNTERFTDYPDEVQVRGNISLDKICGLTFPTESFLDTKFFRSKKAKLELLKEEINIIRLMLNDYNHSNINIYDVDTLNELNNDFIEEKVMK